MIAAAESHAMRCALALPLLALLAVADEPLPEDVAAASAAGKWQVRYADLYLYLVRYHGKSPDAKPVLPDYLKQRLVQAEARARGITVTEEELSRWLEQLDQRIRRDSGGTMTLDDYRKEQDMPLEALRRRAATAVLRERLARAIYCEKDPSRRKDQEVPEDSVDVVIDELYRRAPREEDPAKLRKGLVATVGSVEITEYEYGRELRNALSPRTVLEAAKQLVLVEEAKVLLGGDAPPTAEEWEDQKRRFLAYQRNFLSSRVKDPSLITEDTIRQVVAQQRGFTLEELYGNPAFLAEARVRGRFRSGIEPADIDAFFEENKARYSDRLRVARIFIEARAQRQVQGAGGQLRTLEQGKALAEALWARVTQGADFAQVAQQNTDDADVVKQRGGEIPALLVASSPGYEDTWMVANELAPGGISKPFFSKSGGYVIVKLLERQTAAGLEETRGKVREDIAHQRFLTWRDAVLKNARYSKKLTEGP